MASSQSKDKTANNEVEVIRHSQNVEEQNLGSDLKEERVVDIGKIRVLGLSQEDEEFYLGFPADARKKLIHKVT